MAPSHVQEPPRERPIFSRDLLEAEIPDERRKRVVFTVFDNHLKSKLATNDAERRAGNARRRRQAQTIAEILGERRRGPFVLVGDMNDRPTSAPLRALRELGLVDALADPDETGGPYPPDDPDQPRTKAYGCS